ncbi:MAG: tyrosine-type recombinase/integrase [Spirochaetales bacterium]|nr:tyrosine-type recombinase/integrase [Spirochaetales bacterium]
MKTNGEYREAYLEYLRRMLGYSPNTVASYGRDLKKLTDFLDSRHLSLEDFAPDDARSYTASLMARKLSPASVNRILSSTRGFFHYLCIQKVVQDNPFARIKGAGRYRRLPSVLSRDEVQRILDTPYDDYNSLLAVTIFNLLYSTGCRLSEMTGMNMSDLDLDGGRILVTGKGSKQRYVFLTPRAKEILIEYLKWKENLPVADGQALLTNKSGKRLSSSFVHSIFNRYKTVLGITRKFSPHVFRHSFATHMLDNDSGIRVVQEMLGHSSISTTQVYTHLTGERLRRVYRQAFPHERKKE